MADLTVSSAVDTFMQAADAAAMRAAMGATTAGAAVITVPNPSAITFLRLNANNTVSALSAADFKTALGISGSGAVVAVKSVTKTDTQTTTTINGDWTDVTGLTLTYTPTNSANGILVLVTANTGIMATTAAAMLRVVRDGSAVGVGATSGSRTSAGASGVVNANGVDGLQTLAFHFLDTPGDTSSHTWKVQFCALTGTTGTAYINRTSTDGDVSYTGRGISTLTIMEVTP